ncbi:MAG: patatin-like phospholipase family protein [Myxococcota bacterium]
MRSFAVVWVLGLAGCVAADLGNRAVFAEVTYGLPHDPAPAPQPTFQLFAELQGVVAGPWNDASAAAQCLASVSAADLERLGRATSGTRDPRSWAQALWAELASLRVSPPCAAGFASDPEQLAWAVGKSADTVFSFAGLTWLDASRRPAAFAAGADALHRAAEVVRATPPNQAARAALPVLALSGGAANGAFTAGFLFETLTARELALARLPADERAEADVRSRFSAVVGTSVGALLAQLLDLSLVEGPFSPPQQAFLDACNAMSLRPEVAHGDLSGGRADCFSGWPARPFPGIPPQVERPVQRCALALLQRYFADVDEADLMCAEPGSVLRAVGLLGAPRTNFIRFDPMQRQPLDDVLGLFHQQMRDDGLLRVVMSTETTQNQLVGFDERACGAASAPGCLGAGLMASLVLPVFARPVTHASSGFAEKGECGVWIDGGLRSVLPALRALSYSRPTPLLPAPTLRVLALDTGRLTSLPSPKPRLALDPMLNSLEQFASQQDLTELAFAQRAAELRDDEVEALAREVAAATPTKLMTRPSVDDARVDGVYVPSDVPDWVVAGAGYSFDRYVMRGLFLWGQQVARARFGGGVLAKRLGWPAALVTALEAVLAERAADPDFQQWLASYQRPVCPTFEAWRNEQGKKRINETMALCVEPAAGPAYFSCPAGAWDLGGTP